MIPHTNHKMQNLEVSNTIVIFLIILWSRIQCALFISIDRHPQKVAMKLKSSIHPKHRPQAFSFTLAREMLLLQRYCQERREVEEKI